MTDTAMLTSGTISANQLDVQFKNLISSVWQSYELRLYNVFPQLPFSGFKYLFLQVSVDHGAHWDEISCDGENCDDANYSFGNMYTIPGGSTVSTRNSNAGGGDPNLPQFKFDEEFEIAQLGPFPTGICGSIRFFAPLSVGIFKHFQWDTTYFSDPNFCRESGGGYWRGPPPHLGHSFNAFRMICFPSDTDTERYWRFGGGGYSLWG